MSHFFKKEAKEIENEKSSGNIFKDLGFENPDLELMRARLSLEIFKILEKKNSHKQKQESYWVSASQTFQS